MADFIQERVAKPQNRETQALMDKASRGLVRRREDPIDQMLESQQEDISEVIAGYIARIRQNNPVEAIEDYIDSTTEEGARDSGTWNFDNIEDFAQRLAMSESSGRSGVQIQTQSSGRQQNMTGLFQFSDDRLTDYMNDTGASFSTEEFRADPDLQREVFAWHINDIDSLIRDRGFLEQGFDLDGLRAVAHLGGKTGMIRYATSGGEYNPSDEFGTSLDDYYRRFSGE